ncbi:G-alpha-domain-containing protein [Fomitiporia mediterranea MF3/22]|uniref:G-alpha-domain-containing protein n=1 Tax=Fomitiporia mediterranea (strain MF3/22) TaxID=694068 RepID=UPI000440953C|nr:G-alpha-domain-containing protein [Fomitiporia mediterranea MF3/22]EJD05492.1 G-alpha-domain-containing protein [Fomitiporia mediterranea MF3/22]
MPDYRSRAESSQWPPRLDIRAETADEAVRIAALDWEAKLASDKIDLGISAERSRRKKNKTVKILLLGQSESGKSTTLRNFQLNLAPRAFQADAEAWRTVIHLNLLISVNFLLDILRESLFSASNIEKHPPTSLSTPSRQLVEREISRLRALDSPHRYNDTGRSKQPSPTFSIELRRLMLSLLPLRSIETTLRRRLGAESPAQATSFDESTSESPDKTSIDCDVPRCPAELLPRPASALSSLSGASNVQYMHTPGIRRHSISSSATSSTSSSPLSSPVGFDKRDGRIPAANLSSDNLDRGWKHRRQVSRLYGLVDSFAVKVRGSTGWRRRARLPNDISSRGDASVSQSAESVCHSRRSSFDSVNEQEERELLSARQIIQVFGEDIERLWRHEELQRLLKKRKIRLENRPGFFLNDVPRITAFDYIPTTADILRARLQTTGVEEHRLVLETGRDAGKEWIIYDVGGFRSQRAAWAPFFDSVNAIIFLAPISSFDEWLAEDPSVNRLEDTYHLWREICANRLLASVEFILFLNKYDALRAKLRSGIRFADYVINYDDENGTKNDADSISRYMLATFHTAHKRLSPRPRKLRSYLTSVIDSRATSKVVHHIHEQVLIGNLTDSDIL